MKSKVVEHPSSCFRIVYLRPSSSSPWSFAYRHPHHFHQSSSSWFSRAPPPCIALCRALKASARPPAKVLGVALPLSVPLPLPRLTALSRAAVGGGIGLLAPGVGRFAGGAGGAGLALFTPLTPFAEGVGRAGATGGGGGGGARVCSWISSTYAEGVQPEAELLGLRHSHQPINRVSIHDVHYWTIRVTIVCLLHYLHNLTSCD